MTETFELARKNMVLNQLRPNKIKEENILKAFESIPKENYLTDNIQKSCYFDNDIDVTKKRGYLKNLNLAQLIKYSEINRNDRVLHIGGLTGYFSTLLSTLCNELYVLEEDEVLFDLLKKNINQFNNENTYLINGKLTKGLEDKSPFNLIIIDGPVYELPQNIKKQIFNKGGRLTYIKKVNENFSKAYKITRNENLFSTEYLFDVMSKYSIQEKKEQFNF
ncbi:hypothetical protein OAJ12_02210 [Pelagibacteraceae bacterium]|nr:hypothetical protein [Pelagibacteraceae bacterium]